MANFIDSVGYGLGRLHSGLIAYLCDLYNEGNKEALYSFANELGVAVQSDRVRAKIEYHGIDLVIFCDSSKERPLVVIEMKVDDHEGKVTKKIHGETKSGFQTEIYPQLVPQCQSFLFVTLGTGEYYDAPRGTSFHWVRIRDFHRALSTLSERDPIIEAWRQAVKNEIELQELCFSNDRTRLDEYRTRTWNMYLLGSMNRRLTEVLPTRSLKLEPTAYMYGPKPDTILNFGMDKAPFFMEINDNGHLNLKADLTQCARSEDKHRLFERGRSYYTDLLRQFRPTAKKRKRFERSKTITVVSFEIGLEDVDGFLSYRSRVSETTETLAGILKLFYGRPSCS